MSDFPDIRIFQPGKHCGILLIRLINPNRRKLFDKIKYIFETESVDKWKDSFVVLPDHKLKVRKPAEDHL